MVGVLVPMAVEGRGDRRSYQREANTARRTSCTSYVKPLLKKNSRSRLKTFQVSIQVEGQEEAPRPQLVKRGSTTKLVLPWASGVDQVQVAPLRKPPCAVTKAPPASPRVGGGLAQFQQEALEEHNQLRARHGVQLLELREELCAAAQQYADHLAASGRFEHSGDPRFGENLYWGWSSLPGWVPGGGEAVASWYAEGEAYDYSREPPADTPAGHFTQLVWSGSSAMGVGLAASAERAGKWVVVVKYDPPGNWLGRYSANVPPPARAQA